MSVFKICGMWLNHKIKKNENPNYQVNNYCLVCLLLQYIKKKIKNPIYTDNFYSNIAKKMAKTNRLSTTKQQYKQRNAELRKKVGSSQHFSGMYTDLSLFQHGRQCPNHFSLFWSRDAAVPHYLTWGLAIRIFS